MTYRTMINRNRKILNAPTSNKSRTNSISSIHCLSDPLLFQWRSGNSHHQSLPFTASNFPASIPLFLLSQPLCAPECQSFLKYCFKSSKNPSEQSNFLFLLPKPAEYQQDLPGTPTVGPAAQSPLLLTTTPLPTFPGASLGSFTLCINSSQSSPIGSSPLLC